VPSASWLVMALNLSSSVQLSSMPTLPAYSFSSIQVLTYGTAVEPRMSGKDAGRNFAFVQLRFSKENGEHS